MELQIDELHKLLKRYILAKKPFFIHGTMGIGKSEKVREVCKEIAVEKGLEYSENGLDKNKYNLIDLRISQLDPTDLRGIPCEDNGKTKWLIPKWLPTEGRGCLFMDELNLAPPSVQAACFQLILDRRLGDYFLPSEWTIIAAGNLSTDKSNIFPMASPLKNRFSHATLLPPSVEKWTEWAAKNNIRGDIIAFLNFKPSFMHKFDSNSKDDAFPTHRTWALASHMLEGIESVPKNDGDMDEEWMIVASCVGEGVAHEYKGFINLKKKVKIDDILKSPKLALELEEIGLKHSLISGLAEKYRQITEKKKRQEMLAKILKIPAQEKFDVEFGALLLRLMNLYKPTEFKNDLMDNEDWSKTIFGRYGKYLL